MAKFNIKTVKPKFVVATTPETKIDVSINRPIITAKNQKAYFKLKNTGGPKGEKGDPGAAATIAVGSTSTGAPGTNASVTNSGTSSAAVLNFTIPRGDKGDKGDTGATGSPGAAATISVGTTTTGQPGTNASVTNVGTSSAAVLNFTIPKGAKGDTGATGAPGATGSPGAAATVSVGTTTTGQPGTNASVTNSGTQSAAVLNFTIPKGDKGDNGNPGSAATIAVGTVTTLQPNQSAYVTNVGTSSAAVFDIGIPKGEQGQAGSGSGDMLAADYDPNGTVQNAGGIVAYVASEVPTKTSELLNDGSDGMAAYLETDETAYRTASIPYGECDNTSTSTAFTATVPGITALRDGVCMWLKNGVVTSATGFTVNINGLGAKPIYNNMAAAAQESTIFNVNYTMLFVYDSTRVAGGCWVCYRGYNSDTNTIGYQLRTNSTLLNTTDRTRYYRLLFTSADNREWVPANTQYDNDATSIKTVNTRKINPFGRIVYMSGTTNYAAGSPVGAAVVWDQYAISLGYSFNMTGSALTLSTKKPVYVKCAPQADGSAIIDSTTPYVQDLPTTDDGKIYIFLGMAYSATNIELVVDKPVYYYKDGSIRLWTNAQALPTVNDATLTIEQNGVSAGTFTANASSNATISLTDTTYSTMTGATSGADGVSGLVPKPSAGDQDKVLSGAATWVAQPTVNDATLTINQNGVQAGTFTANAASNATISLTDTTYSDMVGATSGSAGTSGLVPQPSAGDEAKVLSGAATWIAQPTVNDASLTIKQNNVTVGTFSANSSTATTATINAPNCYNLYGQVQTSAYRRSVIALCKVSTTNNGSLHSWFTGRIAFHRDNGLSGVEEIHINMENQYSLAYYTNVSYITNFPRLGASANKDSAIGWRPCTFKYDNVYYGGIEFCTNLANHNIVAADGMGNFDIFGVDYYSMAHDSTPSSVLNSEINNSINFSQWEHKYNHWYVGNAVREIIYNNGSGTNANFQTTAPMSGYDTVEVCYRDGNNNYALKYIPGPAGNFVLDIPHPGASGTVYWYISRFIVSGTSITVGANNVRKAISTSISSTTSQDIYITRMTGIKW